MYTRELKYCLKNHQDLRKFAKIKCKIWRNFAKTLAKVYSIVIGIKMLVLKKMLNSLFECQNIADILYKFAKNC